jgi:8-oxo-dGTP pyrophosphatase MutT (NUDIX family)
MYLKIYFNDKPLFLADAIDQEIEPYVHHDDAVFIDEFSTPGINSMLHEMRLEKIHAGIYYHPHLEELKKAVWKKFVVVKAAGALVLNEKKQILFIFRRGKWDLPKGKLDKGETLEQCAVRETEEETGMKNLKLERPLLTTYHTYDENGRHILKETYWYLLYGRSSEALVPQTNEDIEIAKWVSIPNLQEVLKNTYPSIRDVIEKWKAL